MLVKHTLCLSAYSITVRVGNNIAAVHLHKVGLYEKAGLAAAGTADNKNVFVSCILRLLRAAAHHQPFSLCQQHVIFKNGVDIRFYILRAAP